MNKICLIGRLTKDVELKATPSGKEIASFNLAVQRNYKNAEGEYEADFISCKAFEKKAEIISKFFKKGSQIGIEGHIQTGSYTKDDGTTVYTIDPSANVRNVHENNVLISCCTTGCRKCQFGNESD